jgi:hypothetical protein
MRLRVLTLNVWNRSDHFGVVVDLEVGRTGLAGSAGGTG